MYDTNFFFKGKAILKSLAVINHHNLFFKTGKINFENFDFEKRFNTLLDFLYDLLNKKMSIREAKLEQKEMQNKIKKLKRSQRRVKTL